ncbi:hypothetical protein GCM10009104_13280 [Marinobacterium maritimum]|uniref:C4-dicarboxylate ABC transporter substrate-binding protein n=1 Tax=Marinobacterium maritimum TaxID=500162 RepID=A0ABN1I4K4_9GAMM
MSSNRFLKAIMLGPFLTVAVSQASADLVLPYVESSHNRWARDKALQYFADQVERVSGEKLKLEIHRGGTLMNYSGLLGSVASGTHGLSPAEAVYNKVAVG